jgi:DNA-binding response OmpR family regulator
MNKRTLIVDDDKSVREALSKVLREEGFEPSQAADGVEAFERMEKLKFGLVLLDIGLPGLTGWEVYERIQREDPALPVIVITGQASQFGTAAAADVGALMEKPLEIPRLLRAMRRLLAEPPEARLRRGSAVRGQNKPSPPDIVLEWRRVRVNQAALCH